MRSNPYSHAFCNLSAVMPDLIGHLFLVMPDLIGHPHYLDTRFRGYDNSVCFALYDGLLPAALRSQSQ